MHDNFYLHPKMKDLENLTLKILKTSKKFTSNDFIKAYNIIYLHCTQQTDNYEIKGRILYENLEYILTNFFKEMRPISSFDSFYMTCIKLEESFDLLEKVFFYLERFFINVNLLKKGSDVTHLMNLYYQLLYKHFIFSSMANIEEYFIYELECLREDNIEEIQKLKKVSDFLKNLFSNIENEIEYDHFIELCINSFNTNIQNENIDTLIKKVSAELALIKELFDFTDKKFYFEITKSIAQNYKKFLDWYFCRRTKENLNVKKSKVIAYENRSHFLSDYKDIKVILFNMDDKYVTIFFSKLKIHLLEFINSLDNIKNIFAFFVDFKNTFSDRNCMTNDLENIVEKEIILKIENFENIQDHFCDVISDFIKTKQECYQIPEYLFYLTNLIQQKNQIIKKFSQDCLQRIINDNTCINIEQKLIHFCEIHCESSSVSWLKLIVQTYSIPIIQNFGLSDQEVDFNTEMRLITKGFCNLEITETILHPKLLDLRNILLKRYMLRYPRSEILCSYSASPLNIEINGVDLRMSTDKVSLLLFINNESNLELIKCKTKDPNFEYNIKFLEEHKIINKIGKSVYLNKEYTNNTENIVNLFDFTIKSKLKIENKPENVDFTETAVESQIMKYLKKIKTVTILELENYLYKIFINEMYELKDIINKLETKGYLKFTNKNIVYVP